MSCFIPSAAAAWIRSLAWLPLTAFSLQAVAAAVRAVRQPIQQPSTSAAHPAADVASLPVARNGIQARALCRSGAPALRLLHHTDMASCTPNGGYVSLTVYVSTSSQEPACTVKVTSSGVLLKAGGWGNTSASMQGAIQWGT